MQGRVCHEIKMQVPHNDDGGLLSASGPVVPVNGTYGYRTGCDFKHTDGGVGTAFYVNEGTLASSLFVAVAGLTAAQEALLTAELATHVYISKGGNDTTGDGSRLGPFLTVTAGLAAVTAARKIVMIGAGEYEETTGMTFPTINGVKVIGVGNRWETVIKAAAGDQVLNIAPGAQASSFEVTLQNIQIDHDTTGQDGIVLTHTSVGKKMLVYLGNVGFAGDSSDLAIKVVHGGSGNAVRIYWDGGNGDCESALDLDSEDGGDKFFVDNVNFLAGIDAGAADTTQEIRLRNCQILANAAFSGGGANGIVNLISCWSLTGTTYAIADAADVTTAADLTNPVIVGG